MDQARCVPATEVMSGDVVFRLMDSNGLPLEIILDRLGRDGLGFDVPGFIDAALASGNFTDKRLFRLLTSREVMPDQNPDVIGKISNCIRDRTSP